MMTANKEKSTPELFSDATEKVLNQRYETALNRGIKAVSVGLDNMTPLKVMTAKYDAGVVVTLNDTGKYIFTESPDFICVNERKTADPVICIMKRSGHSAASIEELAKSKLRAEPSVIDVTFNAADAVTLFEKDLEAARRSGKSRINSSQRAFLQSNE